MLHHVSVGVADVTRAASFYDSVLGALGYKRVMEFMPYAVAYGVTAPAFWVQLPHDQKAASSGNGTHIGFTANNRKAVHAFHEAALAAGGTDAGAPGPRPEYTPNYYGAFVRDLDGNKIEAVFLAIPTGETPAKTKRSAKRPKKAARPRRRKSARKGVRKR